MNYLQPDTPFVRILCVAIACGDVPVVKYRKSGTALPGRCQSQRPPGQGVSITCRWQTGLRALERNVLGLWGNLGIEVLKNPVIEILPRQRRRFVSDRQFQRVIRAVQKLPRGVFVTRPESASAQTTP